MTSKILQEAQDYLTINNGDNQVKRIINIEKLLKRHPSKTIISLLTTLHNENKNKLKDLIVKDKTATKIDELIVKMFRIKMAISTLKEREVIH